MMAQGIKISGPCIPKICLFVLLAPFSIGKAEQ